MNQHTTRTTLLNDILPPSSVPLTVAVRGLDQDEAYVIFSLGQMDEN
jgi:hypothetical protein